MKKDSTRDYATEAFRLYAMLGKPKHADIERCVFNSALKKHKDETPQAEINAKAAVKKHEPALLDILAVEKTLEALGKGNKSHIVRAVEGVYFPDPERPLGREELTNRVQYFAIHLPASDRTVYYWLKEARLLFASFRGLRTNNEIMKSLQ